MNENVAGPKPSSTTHDDADVLLAAFPRADGSETRLMIRAYKGARFADLRVWFRNEQGELTPSRKGATIQLDDLPKLADAIVAAVKRVAATRSAAA